LKNRSYFENFTKQKTELIYKLKKSDVANAVYHFQEPGVYIIRVMNVDSVMNQKVVISK